MATNCIGKLYINNEFIGNVTDFKLYQKKEKTMKKSKLKRKMKKQTKNLSSMLDFKTKMIADKNRKLNVIGKMLNETQCKLRYLKTTTSAVMSSQQDRIEQLETELDDLVKDLQISTDYIANITRNLTVSK